MKLRHPLFVALVSVAIVGAPVAAACLTGCNAQDASAVTKDVLSVAQVLCVLNNAELQSADIAKACAIEAALVPAIDSVIGAHKKGIGLSKGTCSPTP